MQLVIDAHLTDLTLSSISSTAGLKRPIIPSDKLSLGVISDDIEFSSDAEVIFADNLRKVNYLGFR